MAFKKRNLSFISISICNSVCHVNLESELRNWVLYNLKSLSLVTFYTEEIFTKIGLIKNILLKWWDNFVVKISNVQFKQLSQQLLRFSENLVKDSVVLLPDSLQAKQGKIQCYREELLKKIYQLISKIPLFNIGRILAMI